MQEREGEVFSIGDLCRMCGVTVRTLQYYDRIGLLKCSFTQSGRRMYRQRDLLRLQQILFLKSLGFKLDEIAKRMETQGTQSDLAGALLRQKEIALGQIGHLQKIVSALDVMIDETRYGEVSLQRLMAMLELMKANNPYTFVVRYFSEDQFEDISCRFGSQKQYDAFVQMSAGVFAKLEELYRKGADPKGPQGMELAEQWWKMVRDFSNGDERMVQTLIASGKDIDNWPEEADGVRTMIKEFLSVALANYLERTGEAHGMKGEFL